MCSALACVEVTQNPGFAALILCPHVSLPGDLQFALNVGICDLWLDGLRQEALKVYEITGSFSSVPVQSSFLL